MMNWKKRGLIYQPKPKFEWMQSHAQAPVVDKINNNRLRIYFGTRDCNNRTLTSFIEVNADNPSQIVYEHNKPILDFGRLGTFDDSGIMPSDIVSVDGKKYLYYMGWNKGGNTSYRIANGLAVSIDGGVTFKKISEGPIMDRSFDDPLGVSIQRVIIDSGVWKTWYLSFSAWDIVDGITEPYYTIKYAESRDGIYWNTNNKECLPTSFREAIAAPFVIKKKDKYIMWYCYRLGVNYRSDPSQSYSIGYAESIDGIAWERMDEKSGISKSSKGWDSKMIEYPYIYNDKNRSYLFYNGNGFGKTGFGYAELSSNI